MAEQELRGLTLTQPWASLMAIGAKKIETRSWYTNHRGLVAIHAAKTWPRWAVEYCFTEPFTKPLLTAGIRKLADMPIGAIVAVGKITDARCTETIMDHWRRDGFLELGVAFREPAFGDYSPGRYGWIFTDIKRLRKPVPCTGSQGLWRVPREITAQVYAQIEGVSPCQP